MNNKKTIFAISILLTAVYLVFNRILLVFLPSIYGEDQFVLMYASLKQYIAIASVLLTVLFGIFIRLIMKLPLVSIYLKDILNNRNLIKTLSINDFKTKYMGSQFGTIWAFIQPIMTILIYWFVFQVGFRAGETKNVPFIIWLASGMVSFFYFQDSVINGSNCFIEYSFLVKKVLFNIKILPLVKLLSSTLVHLLFLLVIFILFLVYRYNPGLTAVQIVYFSFCTFCLCLSISYITAPIMVFFKDLGQIINIYMQMSMWLTPILWDITIVPEKYRIIFEINPMYYIVNGYRDSLVNHVWMWHNYKQAIYFWCVTGLLFSIGLVLYKKLKPHFADVL